MSIGSGSQQNSQLTKPSDRRNHQSALTVQVDMYSFCSKDGYMWQRDELLMDIKRMAWVFENGVWVSFEPVCWMTLTTTRTVTCVTADLVMHLQIFWGVIVLSVGKMEGTRHNKYKLHKPFDKTPAPMIDRRNFRNHTVPTARQSRS